MQWLCFVALLMACRSDETTMPPTDLPGGGADDAARAEALLDPASALPVRAKVVALSDRLSIAAAEDKNGGMALSLLAARLRERLWRFDRAATDAREAVELYGQLVDKGGPQSCEADLRRARLLGEMAADGLETFRQLFLAQKRQGASQKNKKCVDSIGRMLEAADGFRPTGAAWEELQAQAARESSAARATPAASGSAGVPPPVLAREEVVVLPDDKAVKDGPVVLQDVNPYSWKLGGRVVLSLSHAARYETGMLAPDPKAKRGHRLYLDLLNTKTKPKLKKSFDAKGLITGVRLGQQKGGTRVVLDLSDAAYRRIFYLPDPFRVVIDVSTRSPASAAATVEGGRRLVRRVTLDPGHGGWDAGAVGPTGLREKDVALDVAHRAATALASDLGVDTMLTRDTDVFIPLEERTARANGFQSDLFLSIHCNATVDGHAKGLEVYILDPSREQDRQAFGAVQRENQSTKTGKILDPQALDAQVASIARGLDAAHTTEGSRLLADLLRKSTMSSLGQRYAGTDDHGVKTAGFFVLLGAQMPSVLYETAFISNPDDEARLGTADYRQKLADAIVNSVRAYREGHK
jgi:N-acetylmuramoyl-L-alanine amidase